MRRSGVSVISIEEETNYTVVTLVELLKELLGEELTRIDIQVQASGEYPYRAFTTEEQHPQIGLATVKAHTE